MHSGNYLAFCDMCGRELASTARFCDLCGRPLERPARLCDVCGRLLGTEARFCDMCATQIVPEEAHPVTYPAVTAGHLHPRVVVLRPTQAMTTKYERRSRIKVPEMVTRLQPEAATKPPPAYYPPPTATAAPKKGPARVGRFHITRRILVLSAVGLIAIAIVAFPLLGGAITVPDMLSHLFVSPVQTSETTTTEAARPALVVQITISKNPNKLGDVQTITVLVLDQNGQAVSNASVHLDLVYPSGNTQSFDRFTSPEGECSRRLQISALSSNVGTFQVTASATKPGYEDGKAKATFEATAT